MMRHRNGPQGVHFFDRRTGLNILVDEVSPPPTSWARAPRYMSIALTNACELTCAYCYAAKAPARRSAEQVARWAAELDAAGAFGIGFGGGEPTLFPGFPALCRRVHDETGLALTFTTHGHRFTPALVEELVGAVDLIRLSMDGTGETYERLRGRPFSVFRDKLALVRETAAFGINMVLNGDTISDLPEAAAFAFGEGARELLLLPETGRDGRLSIDPDSLARASAWVEENHRRVRLATSDHAVEALAAPRLPVGTVDDPSLDFMHIDAFGVLKNTAFERDGVALERDAPLIPAIEALRSRRRHHPHPKMEAAQ